MKKHILITGVLAVFMLGSEQLQAQRGRSGQRDRGERDRVERRDDNVNRRNDRIKGNRNRQERIVDRNYISYDGYRGSSYYRHGRGVRDYRRAESFRRPYQPSRRHIWIAGHWKYSRRLGREVWRDGYWTVRTKNHRFVPGHYQRQRGVRVWIPGCWVTF